MHCFKTGVLDKPGEKPSQAPTIGANQSRAISAQSFLLQCPHSNSPFFHRPHEISIGGAPRRN
jgi:hypothetical protein